VLVVYFAPIGTAGLRHQYPFSRASAVRRRQECTLELLSLKILNAGPPTTAYLHSAVHCTSTHVRLQAQLIGSPSPTAIHGLQLDLLQCIDFCFLAEH
jgi:hypothetical protein